MCSGLKGLTSQQFLMKFANLKHDFRSLSGALGCRASGYHLRVPGLIKDEVFMWNMKSISFKIE